MTKEACDIERQEIWQSIPEPGLVNSTVQPYHQKQSSFHLLDVRFPNDSFCLQLGSLPTPFTWSLSPSAPMLLPKSSLSCLPQLSFTLRGSSGLDTGCGGVRLDSVISAMSAMTGGTPCTLALLPTTGAQKLKNTSEQ